MTRFTTAIMSVFGLLACATAQAQQATTDCTSCTLAQIEALATPCAQGYAYITDFESQSLYKLCYTIDVNDAYRPPRREKEYHWATPEPSAQQLFMAYAGVYQNNGHVRAAAASLRVYIPAPYPNGDNGFMNAYDVLSVSANQIALSNYLLQTRFNAAYMENPDTALAAKLADLLNALQIDGIVKIGGFPVSFITVFNDGSRITVKYNSTTGRYEPVPGTGIDSDGNIIPESKDMASNGGMGQTYGFTGRNGYDANNMQTVLRNLGAQGIPVTNRGGVWRIACTSAGNGPLNCVIQPF